MSARSKQNAYKTPSTYMPGDTGVNPYYTKVDTLWGAVQESPVLDDMAAIVSMFINDRGELDEEAYLDYVDANFGEELDELVDVFEQEGLEQPAMPPAPSPKMLYNRVSDVAIVDVGSGDCTKLSKCQSIGIVAVDIAPVDNPHFKVEKLDANVEIRDFMEKHQESVVTSFNVATQLTNFDQVAEHDGLHVFPDMQHVKSTQVVGEDERGVYYGGYRDRDNGVVGDQVVDGYVALSTYADRKIRYDLGKMVNVSSMPKPQVRDVYMRPVNVEGTPKYDGVCMFLQSHQGRVVLNYRSGRGFDLVDKRGGSPEMVLMLEKLPRVGKPEAFVLLRVYQFRGYYPFHGLCSLRSFVKSVDIRIGGIKIWSPGDSHLERFDCDGIIYRVGQLDLRYKQVLTADLDDPHAMMEKLEDKYGYSVTAEGVRPGLGEYAITQKNGNYKLTFVRERTDKKTTTSLEKLSEMFLWV